MSKTDSTKGKDEKPKSIEEVFWTIIKDLEFIENNRTKTEGILASALKFIMLHMEIKNIDI